MRMYYSIFNLYKVGTTIAPCFSGLGLVLGNIKVIIDCYYSDPPFNLPHHFIVYSVSFSMW